MAPVMVPDRVLFAFPRQPVAATTPVAYGRHDADAGRQMQWIQRPVVVSHRPDLSEQRARETIGPAMSARRWLKDAGT
jgi:hypothetical protein